MSLIQRQEALVQVLERQVWRPYFALGRRLGQDLAGIRSRLKRLHAEELMKVGYTKAQAWESAEQCNDVAFRNMDHEDALKGLGVTA